jgi:hypothetical protein
VESEEGMAGCAKSQGCFEKPEIKELKVLLDEAKDLFVVSIGNV